MTRAIERSRFLDTIGLEDGQLPDVLVQGGSRDDWMLVADAIEGLGWAADGVRDLVQPSASRSDRSDSRSEDHFL